MLTYVIGENSSLREDLYNRFIFNIASDNLHYEDIVDIAKQTLNDVSRWVTQDEIITPTSKLARGSALFIAAIESTTEKVVCVTRVTIRTNSMLIDDIAANQKGAGKATIEYVISIAKDKGFKKIFITAASGNPTLIDYYRSIGFTGTGTEMEYKISD